MIGSRTLPCGCHHVNKNTVPEREGTYEVQCRSCRKQFVALVTISEFLSMKCGVTRYRLTWWDKKLWDDATAASESARARAATDGRKRPRLPEQAAPRVVRVRSR